MSVKRRISGLFGTLIAAAVLAVGLLASPASAQSAPSINHATLTPSGITLAPLYKMWNPTATSHYYANSWNDVLNAINGGWQYQGVTCDISATVTSQPLYQLWNADAEDHYYTASWSDALNAINNGWRYERIVGYLGGTKPLYKMWNPVATDHYYTASLTDVLNAASNGWQYQGITGYCW